MSSYPHLYASTIALLDRSPLERAEYMLVDRFVRHRRVDEIWTYVDFMLLSPPRSRAAGLLVHGKPGSGKTMLGKAIVRACHQAFRGAGKAQVPVLMISMTNAREAKTLYTRLLAALGCPQPERYSGSDRERLVLKLCRESAVKLVIVDEIQDILSTTPRQQRIALDTLKFLMNELSVPLLALGIHGAKQALQVDVHLAARFAFEELPTWQMDSDLMELLDTLEKGLPLKLPSNLVDPSVMKELIQRSAGTLDTLIRLVTWAAAHALEDGEERITQKHIAKASRPPGVVLRRLAEQRAAA